MDILLRRSASLSSHRDRPPLFSDATAQLICQGACRQVDIVRAFGVSKQSVIRSVNKYRAGGVKAFSHASCDTRCYGDDAEGHRPSTTVAEDGWSRREVAEHLGLKLDTLRKADSSRDD